MPRIVKTELKKGDLWKEISKYNNYSVPEDAEQFFKALVKVISIYLEKDGIVYLPWLGAFYLSKSNKGAFTPSGSSKRIGQRVIHVVKFKPCRLFKEYFFALSKKKELKTFKFTIKRS